MAWAPAFLIMMGAMYVAAGYIVLGFTISMAGVVFGITVKRRARRMDEDSRVP
jgi:hypothetical protein